MSENEVTSEVYSLALFFERVVGCILYERGVYPRSYFQNIRIDEYNLEINVITNKELLDYLQHFSQLITSWLEVGQLQQVVVVIMEAKNNKTVECWSFRFNQSKENKQIQLFNDISAFIRQLTSMTSILPKLAKQLKFDILVYTDKSAMETEEWEETEPKFVPSETEHDQLRPLILSNGSIETTVIYQS